MTALLSGIQDQRTCQGIVLLRNLAEPQAAENREPTADAAFKGHEDQVAQALTLRNDTVPFPKGGAALGGGTPQPQLSGGTAG